MVITTTLTSAQIERERALEKTEKSEETTKKEGAPEKLLVNVTIREDWGYDTDYVSLMFFQVTADTAVTSKSFKM